MNNIQALLHRIETLPWTTDESGQWVSVPTEVWRQWIHNEVEQAHNDVLIDETLLQRAIDRWGTDAQIGMVIEECSELITKLVQWRRGRQVDVKEEIADVLIMAHQARQMWGPGNVDEIIIAKQERLRRKLKGEE